MIAVVVIGEIDDEQKKTSLKFRIKHPRRIGKFYHAYDKKGGHPSLVYFGDPDKDTYFIQRFSTKKRKGREKLKFNIDPGSKKEQWLVRRPEVVGYDDMTYKKEYEKFRVHPSDIETVKKYQKHKFK